MTDRDKICMSVRTSIMQKNWQCCVCVGSTVRVIWGRCLGLHDGVGGQ